ncbi:MAG: alpha/beta fold hydrolase [Gemmatimonadota bacterium]|nr:alpha/beta fold hydrolase [Gemmatimonadota bacterium]
MSAICLTIFSFLSASIGATPDFPAYVGNYRLSANETIAIAEWELDPSSPHVLAFTNLKTGRIGVLTEVSNDEFSLREGLLAGSQVAAIRFVRSGDRVIALIYASSGGQPLRAKRVETRREEPTVDAGDVRLGATLYMPARGGPFPVIVIVPAGAVGRTAAATFPNFFVAEGFGVLVYDRRPGSAQFTTYAADAVATVEYLRRRADVDARNIGLWGHSQGGWVSLVAASQSRAISFVIDHSGMLLPAWQQELYRLAAEARADDVAREDVVRALAFEERLMKVAAKGEGWLEVAETMRADEKASWMELVYKPGSLDELQRVWRNDFSFDPQPFAGRVHQPVLALFGGLDKSTPIESAANLANAMPDREKLTIEFFPTANHAFLEAKTGGNAEIPTLSHFAPGMFASMHRWLRANIRVQ